MLRYFRRRRPTPVTVQQITREDLEAAYAWDLTLTQWKRLTDRDRADLRDNITNAPRFEAAA